jgi:hypothetical protein
MAEMGQEGLCGHGFNHLLDLRKLPKEEPKANSGAQGRFQTLVVIVELP